MTEKKWHNLKDTPLAKLLHAISLRNDEAGALDLTRGMMKRRIYFQNGWPVHVASNSLNDVLGRVLMEEGIISQKDYEKSLEIVLKQKKRYGEVLISMGLISQKGLADYLALQMKKKIWSIFNWPDGEYKYFLVKGGLPANLELLPMNPASLIINGILHGYCRFERAEAELKKFMDAPLVVSPDKPYKIEDLGLNTQQSRFIAGFDGAAKTKEIINKSDLLHREAELLTYGLIITDILSPKRKTVELKSPSEDALRYEAHEEYIEKGAKEETYAAAQKMDAELIFQKGKKHLAERDYEKAAADFEEIVRLNPAEAEYKAYLGWVLFNKDSKNIEKAKKLLMESLSINPDLGMAHLFLARLYIKEGLFKEAEGDLAAALGKTPFLPAAWKERTLIKIRACFDIRKKGYVDYFHLTKNPFDLLPDPDSLYQGDAHSEALLFLLNNLKSGRGNVILLTGEKGSGKTSLCLKIMDALADEKAAFVYIDSPLQSGLDILIAIKNELGIKTSSDFSEDVISALYAHCSMCREAKGRTIVILGNAHKVSANALVGIKTLLKAGIDNIIISGQPEIENMLNAPDLKEIKQAVSGTHHMHPLSPEETKEYILKKLASAGSDEKMLQITQWAIKNIHISSLGNPEMINKICDLSLDLAMKKAVNTIDEQIVTAAESRIGAELDERLPQLEPIEEKADAEATTPLVPLNKGGLKDSPLTKWELKGVVALTEEKIRKIIDEQIAAAVKEAVNKAMEDAGKTFEQKAQQIVEERIGSSFPHPHLNPLPEGEEIERGSPLPQGEEATILLPPLQGEGRVGMGVKVFSEQKAENPPEEQAREQTGQAASEQITDVAADTGGMEFKAETAQHDTSFISFEADEKKRGRFAKSGLLIKILIFVIAVGGILAVTTYWGRLPLSPSWRGIKGEAPPVGYEIKPSQVKPVDLPKVEPPPVKIAPPAAEVQPAPAAIHPVKEDKTSAVEGLKPVSAEPEAAPKTTRQSPENSQPASKSASAKPSDGNIQGLPPHVSSGGQARLLTLTFEVNGGRKQTVFNGETFKVKRGDKIKIISANAGDIPQKNITVNLLGFVSNKNDNTGEDRGYLVDTAKDLWKKYSKDGKGKEYPIIVKHKGEKIGTVVLKITD